MGHSQARFSIFTDASYDPKMRSGIGGYLCIQHTGVDPPDHSISAADVRIKLINDTTNTRLEIQSIIWALEEFDRVHQSEKFNLSIYTDCRVASGLKSRRLKLQQADFRSKTSGKRLTNADLYHEVYRLCDILDAEIIWVKGHMPSRCRNMQQKALSLVDRTTRSELRKWREQRV